MELTRKQTVESLKEVGHFLKVLDHFKYLREVFETADGMIEEQSHLVSKASQIRERAQVDAKEVIDAAHTWYETQMKEWEPRVASIKKEYEGREARCDESRDELVVIREAVSIEQAALAAVQMTHKQEVAGYNREVTNLQTQITDLRKTAAALVSKFTLL